MEFGIYLLGVVFALLTMAGLSLLGMKMDNALIPAVLVLILFICIAEGGLSEGASIFVSFILGCGLTYLLYKVSRKLTADYFDKHEDRFKKMSNEKFNNLVANITIAEMVISFILGMFIASIIVIAITN